MPVGILLLRGRVVDEHVFDAILLLAANRGAWCLLHLLSSASKSTFLTTVHVLLPLRRVRALVLLQDGPTH